MLKKLYWRCNFVRKNYGRFEGKIIDIYLD